MRQLQLALLACAAACAPLAADALAIVAQPVAFAGDPAPGIPGQSFTTSIFGHASDAGPIAISARTEQPDVVSGVWTWDPAQGGAPAPLVIPGPAAGAPAGVEIAGAFAREAQPSGVVGYEATFAVGPGGVTSATQRALFSYDPTVGHTMVARSGDPAVGIPNHIWVIGAMPDAIPDWNAAGEMLFTAAATPVPGPFPVIGGLWRWDAANGTQLVHAMGDPVPGDPSRGLGIPTIYRLNDAGDMAFAATTGAVAGFGDPSIFAPDGAGGVYEAARMNAPVPGDPAGAVFSFFPGGGFFDLNDLGQLAFGARLATGSGGVTSADDTGIWVAEGPGDLVLRVREGDPVPGAAGLSFGSLETTPSLNDLGELAFGASLQLGGSVTTGNDAALFVPDGAGGLAMLAREGDANPALPAETWGGLFGGVRLDDEGRLFFYATNGGNQTRLWLVDPDGGLQLLTGEGLAVDFGGGDVRTVANFIDWDVSPGLDRYAVTASFTDGSSGLFLLTVPEPGTGAITAAGLALLSLRARRRR